jgi:hypothetical protein
MKLVLKQDEAQATETRFNTGKGDKNRNETRKKGTKKRN